MYNSSYLLFAFALNFSFEYLVQKPSNAVLYKFQIVIVLSQLQKIYMVYIHSYMILQIFWLFRFLLHFHPNTTVWNAFDKYCIMRQWCLSIRYDLREVSSQLLELARTKHIYTLHTIFILHIYRYRNNKYKIKLTENGENWVI